MRTLLELSHPAADYSEPSGTYGRNNHALATMDSAHHLPSLRNMRVSFLPSPLPPISHRGKLLHPPAKEDFLLIIRQLADSGLTVFVSSHDWGTSLNAYDKVVVLDKIILASGNPEEVQEKLSSINYLRWKI